VVKAYGIGPVGGEFVRADVGWPPALAGACGHTAGSAAYRLDGPALAHLIEHSDPDDNAALRWLDGDDILAVLTDDLAAPAADPDVARLAAHLLAGRAEDAAGTTTLWRPTGPHELRLVEATGWRRWPPRLPDQPIFYPVLNEAYATQIAREWNVPASGVGHVTRFRVETAFARRYPTKRAGGGHILELWIPAEDVDALNEHLVGTIELIGTYTD
jgi:hypothetical protein